MHVHVHGRSQLISSTQARLIRRLYLIRHNEAGLPSIWPLVSMETRKINIHTIDNNNNSYQVMTPELHKLAILSFSISPACKYLRRAFHSNRFSLRLPDLDVSIHTKRLFERGSSNLRRNISLYITLRPLVQGVIKLLITERRKLCPSQ